ncbi:hypothetical protein [Aquamicrobium defluvii]|uniref:Uncharacterized protein n=1 Tax=Aquamicrobium defluvii TaxID=69279 RepID=A0A011VMT0_9HYPH|nr:hypothetical protein [Aquamicrobium defluvii]EXL09700.1 hypothetical protein BG36_20320 [Aquamicrobium defluvii]EZQ16515.1 hypothetical protein CF98_41410 [Halopseudomonas bauzanensis]
MVHRRHDAHGRGKRIEFTLERAKFLGTQNAGNARDADNARPDDSVRERETIASCLDRFVEASDLEVFAPPPQDRLIRT